MKNILFLFAFLALFSTVIASEEVRKSNDVLNIPIGAKVLASGGLLLGGNPNVERSLFHPALAVEGENSISVNHINYFAGSDLNSFSGLYKLDESKSAFFMSISRFGADGIPLTFEDSLGVPVDKNGNAIEGNPETFSVQDIWLTSGYGLEFYKMNVGVNFNVLYRDLGDQWAIGLRSDASLSKRFGDFRVDALLKSWSTSALFSEGGNLEYEPMDIYLGTGYLLDVPYFYGAVNFAWQSAAFIHKGNRSREVVSGDRIWDNPGMWLGDSKASMEYKSKWGVGLSLGWAFIREWKYPAWGFNFEIKEVEASYGWEAHPELGNIHSFSINYIFGSEGSKSKAVTTLPLFEEDAPKEETKVSTKDDSESIGEVTDVSADTIISEEILFEEVLAEESIDSSSLLKKDSNIIKNDSSENQNEKTVDFKSLAKDSIAPIRKDILDTTVVDSTNVNTDIDSSRLPKTKLKSSLTDSDSLAIVEEKVDPVSLKKVDSISLNQTTLSSPFVIDSSSSKASIEAPQFEKSIQESLPKQAEPSKEETVLVPEVLINDKVKTDVEKKDVMSTVSNEESTSMSNSLEPSAPKNEVIIEEEPLPLEEVILPSKRVLFSSET